MKRARTKAANDWPVWLQVMGAMAAVLAVGVLAGVGWALLAGGLAFLVVGSLAELERVTVPGARPVRPRHDRAKAKP